MAVPASPAPSAGQSCGAEPKLAFSQEALRKAPPRTCGQCDQNTHQNDEDKLPETEELLLWSKALTNAAGEKYPGGAECYVCMNVRRRYYGLKVSMATIKQSRALSEQEDQRWGRLRRDKARGENKFKDEAISAKQQQVITSDKDFEDAFDVGVFKPLEAFCRQKGMDEAMIGNVEQMRAFVKSKFPEHEVGIGKTGTLGVFVSEVSAGEYKYKKGVRTEVQHQSVEFLEDPIAARERMDEILNAKEARESGALAIDDEEVADMLGVEEIENDASPGRPPQRLTEANVRHCLDPLGSGPVMWSKTKPVSSSSEKHGNDSAAMAVLNTRAHGPRLHPPLSSSLSLCLWWPHPRHRRLRMALALLHRAGKLRVLPPQRRQARLPRQARQVCLAQSVPRTEKRES